MSTHQPSRRRRIGLLLPLALLNCLIILIAQSERSFSASLSFSQVGEMPTWEGGIGQSVLDDSRLYLTGKSGHGIAIVDLSGLLPSFGADPKVGAPAFIATMGMVESTNHLRSIAAAGRYLFVADTGGLSAWDTINPAVPVRVGLLPDVSGNLLLQEDRLFVWRAATGVVALDISDPARMRRLGTFPITLPIGSFFVSGNRGFVLSSGGDDLLHVFDLSTPLPFSEVGSFPTTGTEIFTFGDYIIIAQENGVDILDATNPSAIRRASKVRCKAAHISIKGEKVFAFGEKTRTIIDISNPYTPQVLKSEELGIVFANSQNGIGTVTSGTIGITSYGGSDFLMFDPYSNGFASHAFNVSEPNWRNPMYSDGFIWSYWGAALHFTDIRSLLQPKVGWIAFTDGNLNPQSGLVVMRNTLYSIGSIFRFFDISTPGAPKLIYSSRSLEYTGAAGSTSPDGTYLYLSSQSRLSILNVSNPRDPRIVGTVTLPTPTSEVTYINDYVYVSGVNQTHVIDVANKAKPVLVSSKSYLGKLSRLSPFRLVANSGSKLSILDVTDGWRPKVLSSCPLSALNPQLWPQIQGRYVMCGSEVFDISGKNCVRAGVLNDVDGNNLFMSADHVFSGSQSTPIRIWFVDGLVAPISRLDAFRIGNQLTVSWPTKSPWIYTLEWSRSLAPDDTWVQLFHGDGTDLPVKMNFNIDPSGQGFYRVNVE